MGRRQQLFLTGGTGFLGQHLLCRILEDPAWKAVLLTRSRTRKLPRPHRVVIGDLLKPGPWVEALKGSDVVVHLAGLFGSDPGLLLKANVVSTSRLLEACRRQGIGHFVLASSAAVYGGGSRKRAAESKPPAPDTWYGLTKFFAEQVCRYYASRHGLPVWILRLSNIYGPGAEKGVVYLFLRDLIGKRQILIHGDGRQRRDFLYIRDAVDCFWKAVQRQPKGMEILNIGSGRSLPLRKLHPLIEQVTGIRSSVLHDAPEEHVTREIHLNCRKARRRLSWRPTTSLREGLGQTARWVQERKLRT